MKSTVGGTEEGEQVYLTSCNHDCSARCLLRAYVRDGVIVRLGTADGPAGAPGLRACARGRAYRQRIYAPDRLQRPLRRTGERGEGRFEPVSWDDALDTVAGALQRIKDRYGNTAIFEGAGAGSQGQLHATAGGPITRLLNMFGGSTGRRGHSSYGGATIASEYSYGTANAGNDTADLVNSRFIILWSYNPAELVNGTHARFNLMRAKEQGIRIVGLDPRYSDTIAAFCDEWIPIRPGTDGAMMAAMAHTIFSEGREDRAFLDRYTQGWERFRDYVMGIGDGQPKTPEWAAPICGVPAGRIASLAREYAEARPAALVPGWGYQRTAYGEQPSRMCIALCCLTGNVGRAGGNAGGHYTTKSYARRPIGKLPTWTNPTGVTIAVNKWADAILEGTAGGYEADIHMAYIAGRNLLNQFGNINKNVAALRKLDFIVCHEQFMTPTARMADIVLPITTCYERQEVEVVRDYAIYLPKIIEPLYECRSDLDICTALAERLGIRGYNDKTEEEWLRSFCEGSDIEDFDWFKAEGVFYFPQTEPFVAFREQIEDPAGHPFRTPSGKIELHSPGLEAIGQPETVPSIPKYVPAWEGRDDPLAARYPLQLITPHCKRFTHSTMTNLPWLQELEPHGVWINSADAAERGIADGQMAKVFNGRGEVHIPARMTERIMPGVVCIYQGIWYNPDGEGVDLSGCANVLTRDEDTPVADGATTHSCLVQVEVL